jgi:uncharacterized protein YjbI with pentapeptide repeats
VNNEESKTLRKVTQQELDNIIERQTRYLHQRCSNERPSLANCKLSELVVPEGTNFERMDFRGCEISSLYFKGCKFEDCNFSNSTVRAAFEECEFPDTNMTAIFLEASLQKCTFSDVVLPCSHIHKTTFAKCTFTDVNFKAATLYEVGFPTQLSALHRWIARVLEREERCVIQGCDFQEVTLTFVDFRRAKLSSCDFRGVDLTLCENFIFDDTQVNGARLPIRTNEPWTVLYRKYTGSRMLFNLVFLAIYFTPLIIKALMLLVLAHIELLVANKISGSVSPIMQTFDIAEACAQLDCIRIPTYKLILGYNLKISVLLVGLTLLLYNVLRFILTMRIAPLKEDEAITDRTPLYFVPLYLVLTGSSIRERVRAFRYSVIETLNGLSKSYAPFWYCDRVISIIFYLTILFAAYHI